MASPEAPVIDGLEPFQITFGEGQEGIIPLVTLRRPDGCVMSRWTLTGKERKAIYTEGADIFVLQHTYFNPPMPLDVQILNPRHLEVEPSREAMGLDTELINRMASGDPYKSPAMLYKDRIATLKAQPKKFDSPESYYNWLESLHTEHSVREAEQAEMDFAEWQVAEIVRLRLLLLETMRTV